MNITELNNQRYRYAIDGTPVPGLTTITGLLPKNLDKWVIKTTIDAIRGEYIKAKDKNTLDFDNVLVFAGLAVEKKKTESKEIGKQFHSLLEEHIKTHTEGTGTFIRLAVNDPMYNRFLEWEAKYKPKWLYSELLTGNKDLGYVAIIDAVAMIDGELYIIDFKTSNYVNYDYYLQLTGEILSYKQEYDVPPYGCNPKRLILRFPKDGSPVEHHPVLSNFETDVECLTNLCNLYKCLEISKSYFPWQRHSKSAA